MAHLSPPPTPGPAHLLSYQGSGSPEAVVVARAEVGTRELPQDWD